ncbi:MAG: HDOD domain-containing protein [candidate division Zixibacteria bacterium]|nr:HDOD domain-containing protein [candidate division Zixibacteria bacterium]
MDKLSIIGQIRNSGELLSLPQALSEILREVDNPNFTADSLAKIILKDPSLTARILKLSNSSFYHRFSKTKTVNQAVQVLGVTTVKCLALSTSVFRPEKVEAVAGVNAKTFFADILMIAAASEKIAREVEYKAPEEAFIAGLLHQMGIIFFLHHYPSEYRKIIEKKVKAKSLLAAEVEVFGIDHCEVGYHLATRWRLPEFIANAIRDHHSPLTLTNKVPVSNFIALACLMTNDSIGGYVADMENRSLKIERLGDNIGVTHARLTELSNSFVTCTMSVAEYLDIDIGSIEEMLVRSNRELWQTYLMVENLFKERQELSQKLLAEEHAKGMLESKNIAMATLSHYQNNAAMAVYGRSQILRMMLKKGRKDEILAGLDSNLDTIDNSIRKIVAVLAEMKEVSPIDNIKFLNASQAMNIDDRIVARMTEMKSESGIVMPEEVESLKS